MTTRLLLIQVEAAEVYCGECEQVDGRYCELFHETLAETLDGFNTIRSMECHAAEVAVHGAVSA
jgi:hypothetical protein